MTATAAGFLQLPKNFKSTHDTSGLPGYPAIDVMGRAGTPVRAPVAGRIARFSGRNPAAGAYEGQGGPFGWTIYLDGDDGRSYFLTHFGSRAVKVGQTVKAGQIIGTVGDYPGATPDHIHEGVHAGKSSTGGLAMLNLGGLSTSIASGLGGAQEAGKTAAMGSTAASIAGAAGGAANDAAKAVSDMVGGWITDIEKQAGRGLLWLVLIAGGVTLAALGTIRLTGANTKATQAAGTIAANPQLMAAAL